MTALLEELDHGYESGADIVIALGEQSLFDETIKTLHILFVNNFGEDTERVCLDHIVVTLLDVLAKARDDDEDLILVDF